MEKNVKGENDIKAYKWLNAITFLLMVVVNALANILPINGIPTGAVSDSYPNLFAPAGLTFSIWGLIYLLLAGFVLYQLGVFKGKSGYSLEAVKRIGWYFSISSLANIAWIFSWHYKMIPLSMLLMVVILITLILAYIGINKAPLSLKEKIFVRTPFSIYFGWITVATIANVTTLLVSLGWDGFGISQQVWTIIALAAGLVIGVATTLKNKDIAYGLVILWAYAGIMLKHLMPTGFASQYPGVIIAVAISLGIIIASIVLVGINAGKKAKAQINRKG